MHLMNYRREPFKRILFNLALLIMVNQQL